MSNWERWTKRLLKALLWAFAFLVLASTLDVVPTWQIIVLCCSASFVGFMLDELWPTDK